MDEMLEVRAASQLTDLGLKLVIAESCTGGLIGHRITNIPGSSEFYLGSITAYAYESKEELLGVSHSTLDKFGAVSREAVLEMALGARKVLSGRYPLESIIGMSVSGIAGPAGGMPGKPVGLVWIGLSAHDLSQAWKYQWDGNRLQNKEYSADAALILLIQYLNNRSADAGKLSKDESWTRSNTS
jgi:PncC family amidohydrolase